MALATTVRPEAIASSRANGRPSNVDDNEKTSIAARKGATSLCAPAKWTAAGRAPRLRPALRVAPLAAVADEHEMRPRSEQRLRGAHQETVVLFGRQPPHGTNHESGLGNTEAGPGLDPLGVVDLESLEIHAVVNHEQLVAGNVARGPQRLHQRARAGDVTMGDSGRARARSSLLATGSVARDRCGSRWRRSDVPRASRR